MKIMLSGACGPIFQSYLNYLNNLNIDVLGIDIRENQFTKNLLGDNFLLSPSAEKTPDQYINFLEVNINKFDLFFPYSDEELIALSEISKNSSLRKKVIVSSRKSIEICNNKSLFHDFALVNSIPVPLDSQLKEKIIKPIVGRGGRNIFRVNDEKMIHPFRSSSEWIVSDYIVGDEYSVDTVSDGNGKVIDSIARLRIVSKGVSIESKIHMNNKVIELAELIVSKLSIFGPANVQIIEEKETKNLYVIEVNPRLSGGAIFSALGGMDMIKLTVDYLNNKKNGISKKNDGEYYFRYWCNTT
ncbi:ATP-grasp domain-containing protein [Candidatus Pseudothioglobus singularis]|nr:ATP-grasp domain-containing protein [Candidatus Pseudothioglobus singularis]MDB4848126.1 ATP-grasp domain-containing protein [Candidatus Pseudothioglobus singularis]